MSAHIRTITALSFVCLLAVALLPNANALPTPGLFGERANELTGRYFPEADQTNDYVGYFEAIDTLRVLEDEYPGWVKVRKAADSYGLTNQMTGKRDVFEVPIVEVTNPDSEVPWDERIQILFMLSIHGNEKGGREGGLRVIEDFARNMGMAQWTTQNGAGNTTYRAYLDHMTLLFLIPNADGWAHDEPQYLTSTASVDDDVPPVAFNCANGNVFYCRTNGRDVDLNREVPTMGWYYENYTALSEPESKGYANFILENYHNLAGATDIHGMQNSEQFVLTMLPAAGMTPHEMQQSTRLAEMLKERLNNDPTFGSWKEALGTAAEVGDEAMVAGQTVLDAAYPYARPVLCEEPNPRPWTTCQSFDESPTRSYGSGTVNEWGTVWDSIGYADSGFNGDWFAQNNGLNVAGFDIEMAYNHGITDSQYEVGMYLNVLHIQTVRQIVGVFMDALATDLQLAVDVKGTRTAVLANPTVVTSLDDTEPLGGWAMQNEWDDAWDYANNPFSVTPQQYFRDLKPYLKDGEVPAVFDELNRVDLTPKRLDRYDNLVIPGTAIDQIAGDADTIAAIKAWVEDGGNLVLTDSALQWLELAGVAKAGSVDFANLYAGYTNFFDRGHGLVDEVRGIARQTYEPVPLGFNVQSRAAPNWYVAADGIEGLDAIGHLDKPERINFGQFTLGAGNVRFLGSLLPDPSEEFYHPYGLEPYATTYSGNQLLRNMLQWEQVFEAPPALFTDLGIVYTPPVADPAGTEPGAPTDQTEESAAVGLWTLLVLAFAAVGLRRRR